MPTYDRAALRIRLVSEEGLRLKPYKDTLGKTTIGVGRNLDDVGITAAEAMTLLDHDIDRAEIDLDVHVPWWRQLEPSRQSVLLDMCFNMGWAGLATFHNMLAAAQAGDYLRASQAMLASQWAGQVGSRAHVLADIMAGTSAIAQEAAS